MAPLSDLETTEPVDARPARLRDGTTVLIRPVNESDRAALEAFLDGLCAEARRLRFFTGGIGTEAMVGSIAATGPDRIGLVALDHDGSVLGHAVCIALGEREAEVAVEVADRMHGRGLGTVLVERLAELAEPRGIVTFVAEVLPENRAMLDVFRDGFDAHVRWNSGTDRVEFPTAAWRLAKARYP